METTKWYQSKTLWFNAISIIVIALQAIFDAKLVSVEWLGVGIVVGNALLRLITSTSISK
jgi:hypothetical protein